MKTKHCLIIILLTLFFSFSEKSNAQALSWQWARSAGGSMLDAGNNSAIDNSGNLYVTGMFNSASLTFGTFTLNNASVTGLSYDIFIVKYDSSGNVLWARNLGDTGDDRGFGICTDADNNIYITGVFSFTLNVDAISLSSTGAEDIFILKCDSSGHAIWGTAFGGNNTDIGYDIKSDNLKNIYFSGSFFSSSITIGSIVLTNTNSGTADGFVAKFDSSGNALWAKKSVGDSTDLAWHVISDKQYNVYATGSFFSDSISFGGVYHLNSGTYSDAFIVKYDSSGNFLWSKSVGHSDVSDIATDNFDNLLFTCRGSRMVLNKYSGAGNLIWSDSTTGLYYAWGKCIALDTNDNVYLAGTYSSMGGALTFGNISISNIAGGLDIFIVKYDSAGIAQWVSTAGGNNWDDPKDIVLDANKNIYITGSSNGSSISFGNINLPNAGDWDVFTAKLSNPIITSIPFLFSTDKELQIFPNPASFYFTILFNKVHKQTQVTVTDITGKIIYTTTATETQKIEVNTKGFAEGIYLVQIQTADFLKTEKLIITK